MKKISLFFFAIFVFQTITTSFVYAEDLASLSLNPENPIPKSTVSVKLESYYFDVNTARITWKINKKIVLSGIGEKSLTVKTGSVGEGQLVTVIAENEAGVFVEQEVAIVPSSVSILYEAPKSYVPHFYEGRSLPADGALVKVTAFPQISDGEGQLPPSSFGYTWYVNDSVIESASGYGKQSANIYINYLRNQTDVTVLVRSPKGNTATKSITIRPHLPMPLLYLHDPVFGTNFTKFIEKRFETTEDFTISLEPFYLSERDKGDDEDPKYLWLVGSYPSTPVGGKVLAFHLKEEDYGTKILDISITGPNKLLQTARTSAEIIFDTRK